MELLRDTRTYQSISIIRGEIGNSERPPRLASAIYQLKHNGDLRRVDLLTIRFRQLEIFGGLISCLCKSVDVRFKAVTTCPAIYIVHQFHIQ
jgi:hypothetical protein